MMINYLYLYLAVGSIYVLTGSRYNLSLQMIALLVVFTLVYTVVRTRKQLLVNRSEYLEWRKYHPVMASGQVWIKLFIGMVVLVLIKQMNKNILIVQ